MIVEVGCWPIWEEDIVIGVDFYGFGEVLDGFWVFFGFIGLIALIFVQIGKFLLVHFGCI